MKKIFEKVKESIKRDWFMWFGYLCYLVGLIISICNKSVSGICTSVGYTCLWTWVFALVVLDRKRDDFIADVIKKWDNTIVEYAELSTKYAKSQVEIAALSMEIESMKAKEEQRKANRKNYSNKRTWQKESTPMSKSEKK